MDNYYTNEINEYNSNYKDALSDIEKIINGFDNLYSSFNNSSGNDINRIRNDINQIKNNLNDIKQNISDSKKKTNKRAESCDRCYKKYKNKSYPRETIGDREYIEGASVTINKTNGLINISREYTKKQGLLEYLFVRSAGEMYDNTEISANEMFNS